MRALGWIYLLACLPASAINYPSPPSEPKVEVPVSNTASPSAKVNKTEAAKKVPLGNIRLRIHLGDKSMIVAETEIPQAYSFTHRKGKLQYRQTIKAEEIREISIEDYKGRRVHAEGSDDVFEFEPSRVRIELKDGQVYNLQYLFKELRRIKARNGDGSFTVYGFFADSYDRKKGWSERGGHDSTSHTRRTHPAAFARLEYFEPVERAGAANSSEATK